MPPKCKFKRDEIVLAAFNIARKNGVECVTARAIAAKLRSSPKVIFSLFDGMDQLQKEITRSAKSLYESYIENGLSSPLPFKGVGTSYIKFAAEEPKLFQLLFMQENESIPTIENVLGIIDESYEKILKSIEDNFKLSRETALEIYRHLWIYTHGIAVLIATKVCAFSDEEVSDKLTEIFKGVLLQFKSEGKI